MLTTIIMQMQWYDMIMIWYDIKWDDSHNDNDMKWQRYGNDNIRVDNVNDMSMIW